MRAAKAFAVLLVWLVVAVLVFYANVAGMSGLGLVAFAVLPMVLAIAVTAKIMGSNGGNGS